MERVRRPDPQPVRAQPFRWRLQLRQRCRGGGRSRAYAVGTETDGSITCPADFNGCVGIKPTVGTVPTSGVVHISSSQDSPGSMAMTVRDAASLLTLLTADGHDYAEHAVPGRLAGKRIGVPRTTYWGYSSHADAAAERALGLLAAGGATMSTTPTG